MSDQPENWGEYPAPHYDEDNICQCPDHVAMHNAPLDSDLLQSFIEGMSGHE